MRKYARKIGANEEEFIEAFFEVPIMPESKFRQIADALFAFANQLSAYAYQNVQQARLITELKRAEKARQEHLNFLQTLIDAIPNPIFYKDVNGKYVGCNKALCDFLGLTKEEIIGKSVFEVWPKDLADKYYKMDSELLRQPGVQIYDYPMQHADGTRHVSNINKATYFTIDGVLAGVVGVMVDITDRKRTEKKLRQSKQELHYLAGQLLTAQERERKRMSQDLHDDLGQSLMVLKLQLRAIEKAMPANLTERKQELAAQSKFIDEIADNVRRFSRDLRPAVLDDLGLIVALKRLIEEFGALHGIEVSLDLDDVGNQLSPQAQIIIYRIFQESLTNISKYAQASRVAVSLKTGNAKVSFSVEDNGKGFDLEQVRALDVAKRGLGLTAMEERVRMLGGTLEICSEKGIGTRISFKIPA
jgi:PAS domain S-box-containing protein